MDAETTSAAPSVTDATIYRSVGHVVQLVPPLASYVPEAIIKVPHFANFLSAFCICKGSPTSFRFSLVAKHLILKFLGASINFYFPSNLTDIDIRNDH